MSPCHLDALPTVVFSNLVSRHAKDLPQLRPLLAARVRAVLPARSHPNERARVLVARAHTGNGRVAAAPVLAMSPWQSMTGHFVHAPTAN